MRSDEEKSSGPRPEGRYANYFEIGLNQEEIIIDLGQAYGESSSLHTRIITSPAHAKQLTELLDRSLRQYERVYGPVARGRGTDASSDEAG